MGADTPFVATVLLIAIFVPGVSRFRLGRCYKWLQPDGMKIDAYVSRAYRSVMPAT